MLDFQPPRVFVASGVGQGTTGSGGVLPLPLPPLIINYHGRKPHTYHPEDHVVKHIKIFIREIRPYRFHNCQKNDYELVVEANLSDYTLRGPVVMLFVTYTSLGYACASYMSAP
jgi:hypothetical protein